MVKLQEGIEELEHFIEAEHFVQSQGGVFCLRESCEGCQYADECEHVEDNLDSTFKSAIRACIGVDNDLAFGAGSDRAYKYGLDISEIRGSGGVSGLDSRVNLRYVSEEGYLPESRFNIVKKVNEDLAEDPYVIYNVKDKNYYCIRQVCSECPNFKSCKPTVTKEQRKYNTVAFDLQAQEPRCSTVVTKEPLWIEVFQNKTLRDNSELYGLIHEIFKWNNVDVDKDRVYWGWLDSMFFVDQTEAYYTYYLYSEAKKKPNSKKNRRELKEQIQFLLDSFNEYKETKGRKLKL